MAYTDPNTGATRDKYGNEVARDPTGTARPGTNYMAWAIGVAVAAAIVFAVMINSTDQSSVRTNSPDGPIVTQPVAPKTTP
ncbi:hypothetical protein [Hyphomicrobium sp. LHD-15]|uniref:hypothetical protein n=1 Tax=Hyphomicrobium sp. LHD-15 TaxID=3072142 RepID=UPI00280F136B|nr:hypothetical protein [Hyphomicrobium sp. LHD-15]MDQ8698152.1 hypothetical protein [Hyphomicrobium sp. LHD-15]